MRDKKIPRRGEIFWVNLEPALRSESKKIRPGVIISNDSQNKVGQRVIIAPITSVVNKIYPFEMFIEVGEKKSKIMLDQIRTIDCQRLGTILGVLSLKEIEQVDTILKRVLGLG